MMIQAYQNEQYSGPPPMIWHYIMLVSAVAKASVLGASLGLALLGALDIAVAVSALEWLEQIQIELYFDKFAIGGGAIGAAGQILRMIFFR